MSSIIAICNMALSNIGKENINSLDEATAEARACKQFYGHALDTLLQSYPWKFADKVQVLAEVAQPSGSRWRHAYAKPVDCLKIRWLVPHYTEGDILSEHDEAMIPYDVAGGLILTGLSPACLRYTARIEDPSMFSALFSDALAGHLAFRLALPLTKDLNIRRDAYQLANDVLSQARVADANETRSTMMHESQLIMGRA